VNSVAVLVLFLLLVVLLLVLFLVLLVLLILLLLLLLFLQFFDLLLHEVVIEFGVGIMGIEGESTFVALDGTLP